MVRLTERPDMTIDVYRGHKTTTQQHYHCTKHNSCLFQVAMVIELWYLLSYDSNYKPDAT